MTQSRRSSLSLVALVSLSLSTACGGSETPPPQSAPEPAAPEVVAAPEPVAQPTPPAPPAPTPPPAPAGPRVDVDALLAKLGGADMVEPAPGFPALSQDGAHVAFAFVDGDGGRGNPNLAIRFYRVANGRKDGEVSILSPDEAEGGSTPALQQQLRDRAAQATTKLGEGAFHTMASLVRFDGEQTGTVEGTAEGLKLTWDTEHGDVTVLDEPGGAQRLRKRLRGVHVRGPNCPPTLDPLLRAAWVDATAGVVVLDVAFQGSDSCWEPADDILVARLRPAPRH